MLIIKSKYKRILFLLILFTLFTGFSSASIYSTTSKKSDYILKPVFLQLSIYQKPVYDGVGGPDETDFEKGILKPRDNFFEVEEDKKTIKDIKPKDNIQYYIVQSGDTVAKIAKKFGVSKNTIIWENNLNSKGLLKLKQKLTILPVSGISYKVKKGDNLVLIAKKFNVEVKKIKEFNELKKDTLKIGQKLIIPGGKKVLEKKVEKEKNIKKKTKVKKKQKTYKKVYKSKGKLGSLFIRPSIGRATSPYGRRWGKMHWGVDFAQGRNSPIVAAASGTVVKVYSGCRVGNMHCGGGFGNNILIKHSNGYMTRYAHLNKIYVVKGAHVKQGQLIAGMGNTGHVFPRPRNYKSTLGTHLHFEILKNHKHISPNFLR